MANAEAGFWVHPLTVLGRRVSALHRLPPRALHTVLATTTSATVEVYQVDIWFSLSCKVPPIRGRCEKSQPLCCVIPPYGSTTIKRGSIKPVAPGGATCSKAVRTAFKNWLQCMIQKLLRLGAGKRRVLMTLGVQKPVCRTRFRLLKPCGGVGPSIV